MKAREVHFQAADKQLAAVTGELQSARTALAKEQAAHRGAADEVVRWKAECQTLSKELDNASKKVRVCHTHTHNTHTHTHTLMYSPIASMAKHARTKCVCVCVCVYVASDPGSRRAASTNRAHDAQTRQHCTE